MQGSLQDAGRNESNLCQLSDKTTQPGQGEHSASAHRIVEEGECLMSETSTGGMSEFRKGLQTRPDVQICSR